MPDPIPVDLAIGNFPAGYCYPANPQDFANMIVQLMTASISGLTGINFGSSPTDTNLPWFNTGDGQWYWYFGGDWVRPHWIPASDPRRWLWTGPDTGDPSSILERLDGGDTNAPTDRSGPFWVVDDTYDGSVPIGPGTISTLTPPLTIAVGQTGGNASILLNATTMPAHNHLLPFYLNNGTATPHPWDPAQPATDMGSLATRTVQASDISWTTGNFQIPSYDTGGTMGTTQTPLNLLNPYVGTYVIKRTGRVYIVATP